MKIGVVWGGLWLKNTKTLSLHPLQWVLQRKLWNSARCAQRDESSSSSTHTKSQMCWHGRLTPALGRHRQFTVQDSLAQSMSHRSQGDGSSQQIRWMASLEQHLSLTSGLYMHPFPYIQTCANPEDLITWKLWHLQGSGVWTSNWDVASSACQSWIYEANHCI